MRVKIKFRKLVAYDTERFSSIHGWARWVFLMLIGSFFGRAFYYLGIPPAKIFIGDVVLVLFVLTRPREFFDRWTNFLTRPNTFGPFAWILLLSVLYGVFELIHGLFWDYSVLTALQNLVFNIYPIYFFLGLWVGAEHPTTYRKLIRCWAWMLTIYGPAYLLFLHNIHLRMPGADDVPVFPQAGGGGFIILSILALERKPSRFWLPLMVAAAVMLAVQVRAEWLSIFLAFAIWGVLQRKMTKVISIGALVVVLLTIGFIADINLPSPAERGGNISSREIVARGLSAVNPELAQNYTDSRHTGFYAGTISWRTRWWTAIWDSVNESLTKVFIGNGYGFPLKDLVPYLKSQEIRTPHNIFFFALGYSGWIGVALFFSLQISICIMLWRVYKLTGQSYGVAVWACDLAGAFFGNTFESPMGAIPFYLTMGLIIGAVLCRKDEILPVDPRPRRADIIDAVPRPVYSRLQAG
jgi:hypothetical protein